MVPQSYTPLAPCLISKKRATMTFVQVGDIWQKQVLIGKWNIIQGTFLMRIFCSVNEVYHIMFPYNQKW
jgi:hypothetical protein